MCSKSVYLGGGGDDVKANGRHSLRGLVVCVTLVLIVESGVRADFIFGKATILGPPVNSSSLEFQPCISSDGLSLYFTSDRAGGQGDRDIWVATRPTVDDDWGQSVNLGPLVNSTYRDQGASISADGLELYFGSDRPGGYGEDDLWVTTRATIHDAWCTPVNLGPQVNSVSGDYTPNLSADGLSLYFASTRSGGIGDGDIWVSTRLSPSDPWGEPVNLGTGVNSPYAENSPSISHDGLSLFFGSWRPDVPGFQDAYMATRATTKDAWGAAVNLGAPINTTAEDGTPSISSDDMTLYFASDRSGGQGGGDIWKVPIIRIVDFNGDHMVDLQDLLRMIQSWGKDDPSVDIAPGPWGDGKVDEKDLEVLMSCWGEVYDANFIAHWKLDETEGTVAKDSSHGNNATLKGNPVWQPAGGRVDGALQLDGVDDYVQTPFVLNPSQGALSVLAWVKGGTPGQVILSQSGKADWLSTDTKAGSLMTELKAQGSLGTPLQSQSVVTDGNWHRVGLVWDGTNRLLYVDDKEVARDAQPSLPDSSTGLYMGVGSKRGKATYWSGLIDDVRIYNRVVKP